MKIIYITIMTSMLFMGKAYTLNPIKEYFWPTVSEKDKQNNELVYSTVIQLLNSGEQQWKCASYPSRHEEGRGFIFTYLNEDIDTTKHMVYVGVDDLRKVSAKAASCTTVKELWENQMKNKYPMREEKGYVKVDCLDDNKLRVEWFRKGNPEKGSYPVHRLLQVELRWPICIQKQYNQKRTPMTETEVERWFQIFDQIPAA